MNNVNRVIVGGNLTRDPELRYTPNAVAVCEFAIAVNRSWKDRKSGEAKEEVSYFDVTVFNKSAEICGEHLKKGRPVLLDGVLKQERWEAPDGSKRSRVRVIATSVHFLGAKPGTGEKGPQPEASAPAAAAPATPEPVGTTEDQEPPF